MLAKFSPAISSGLLLLSTHVGSGQRAASRLGLSVQVALVVVPGVIFPSATATPTSPLAGSTTWLPEMPSLFVTQSVARPEQPLVRPEVLRTGAKWVPSWEIV